MSTCSCGGAGCKLCASLKPINEKQTKAWHQQTKIKKTIVDNITFDSEAESKFYQKLKLLKHSGAISDFSLQPKFVLQPGFEKNNKTYKPITYTADFMIIHNDGSQEVIDVKGFEPREFAMKKKMFEFVFSDLELTIMAELPKKYGGPGFIEMDQLTKLRKEAAKSEQTKPKKPKKETKQATKRREKKRTR